MASDDQNEELEVLRSIYGDDDGFFVEISKNSFQFKFGADGESRSFVLQISWPPDYPSGASANVSLDLFYNKHLLPSVRDEITKKLQDEADNNLGMASTFTLVEMVKEQLDELLVAQPETLTNPNAASMEVNEDDSEESENENSQNANVQRRQQMTKAQKRRIWNRGGEDKQQERGWNWVDIVKHLSQTGGQARSA